MEPSSNNYNIRGKRGKFKGKFKKKKESVLRTEIITARNVSRTQRKASSATPEDVKGVSIFTNILHGRRIEIKASNLLRKFDAFITI